MNSAQKAAKKMAAEVAAKLVKLAGGEGNALVSLD